MKPTLSLPYAYELSTRPCYEPDKSTSHPHVLFITFLGLSCGLIPAPSACWPVWVISTQIQFTSKLIGVCQLMTYHVKVH